MSELSALKAIADAATQKVRPPAVTRGLGTMVVVLENVAQAAALAALHDTEGR